ncbi:glutamate synthase large subunit, partial [bacterium]|nr:glutamate synthase large subunit [bacterium]
MYNYFPKKQGLYDPAYEHDACGVGFVCNIKGVKSNKIVKQGLEALNRLTHRGAVGADPLTGDGAGILLQIPHDFFLKAAKKSGINLPQQGEYGSGLVFLPQDKKEREFCKKTFEKFVESEGQVFLGWRPVPVNNSVIGKTAKKSEPVIEQIFVGVGDDIKESSKKNELLFERKLYFIRKLTENFVRNSDIKQKSFFYVTNLSARTFAYKGLLMPYQVGEFFVDLKDNDIKSSVALIHSRYSTNTFPTWDLAQPFRFLAHNGEINTLRGNINWMKAKRNLLKSDLFEKDIKTLLPFLIEGGSDSAILDNALELLMLSGRSLAHSLLMFIPGAWENDNLMKKEFRDFYKYHACIMEPWDGPAAVAVTDGTRVAAILDRNGLRPARYIITKDDTMVLASELGVLDIEPADIIKSGRLEPGKILFINTKEGRLINDEEIKNIISSKNPYGDWLNENLIEFDDLPDVKEPKQKTENFVGVLKAFGYSREDIKVLIKPMAEHGKEPIGSMGNDAPHAVLSKKPQALYTYFKQLFAQVTNPPIDSIREKIVMSLDTYLGPQENILEETPKHCRKIRVKSPILTNKELEKIKQVKQGGFKTKVISLLFDAKMETDLSKVLDDICFKAEKAIDEGYTFIVLSDRGVNEKFIAAPALLAVGAVHHYLVKKQIRSQINIILESGEPREVHHFAVLLGYGVDCINAYLVYEIIQNLIDEKELNISFKDGVKNFAESLEQGLLKILSKMGISTIQSYRGAQIFEAVGVHQDVIDKCFTNTPSRIGGVSFDEIKKETFLKHKDSFNLDMSDFIELPTGGVYQWKKDGECHLWNPDTIAALQDSVRRDDYSKYKEFSGLINDQSDNPVTLRSLLKFQETKPISIDKVESVDKIFKRLATGAMSFGSISKGAHETLAIAMNKLGGRSNTGEGGEDPARFFPMPNGDSKRSAIKQVASGRFGVTTNYLVNADEIQIKIAQGAKPGEGGQLPGHKVSVTIAKTRYTTPGVTLISPPPHHDIYSIEDLAQLIFDLKNTNPNARISVKLVSEIGVGTVAAGVAKGHADMILISGADGGTGASPLSSIKHAGLPWELGLSETHQTLVLNDLRSRVRLQTDGQMR